MHIRAKTKPRGWRNCLQSSERGLCWGTDLEKATKKCTLETPKSTVAFIIFKWKKFGTARTLPTAGRLDKLSWKSFSKRGEQEPSDIGTILRMSFRQSLDLNPIQHLWNDLKMSVHQHSSSSLISSGRTGRKSPNPSMQSLLRHNQEDWKLGVNGCQRCFN